MIRELKTIEEFEDFTKTSPLALIHFWAEWNRYDITAKDILDEIDKEFEGKIIFASLEVDQEHLIDFVRGLGVYNIPAFAYFKNGNKLAVEIGLQTKEGFLQRIEEVFS